MSPSAEHMSWEERHNRVAQALQANPQAKNRAIALKLGISEGTVRYQKKKLDSASPQSPASVDPVAPKVPACSPLSLPPLSARTPSAEERRKWIARALLAKPQPSSRAMALKLDVSEETVRSDRRFLAQSSASVRPADLPTKPIKARLSPTQSPSTLPLPRRRPIPVQLRSRPVPRFHIANSPPEKIGLRTMLKVLQNSQLGVYLARINRNQIDYVISRVPQHLRFGRKLIDGLSTEGKNLTQLLELSEPPRRTLIGRFVSDTRFYAQWLARWFMATIPDDEPLQQKLLGQIQQ